MTIRWRTLDPGEIDHEQLWALLALTAGPLAALTLRTFGLPPIRCAFKAFTGWPCATCGATRSLLALAQGHPMESLALHPLVLPAVIAASIAAPYGLTVSSLGWRRLRVTLAARDWWIARAVCVVTVAVVWWYLLATTP